MQNNHKKQNQNTITQQKYNKSHKYKTLKHTYTKIFQICKNIQSNTNNTNISKNTNNIQTIQNRHKQYRITKIQQTTTNYKKYKHFNNTRYKTLITPNIIKIPEIHRNTEIQNTQIQQNTK